MTGIILIVFLLAFPAIVYATTLSLVTYQLDTILLVIGLAVLGGIVSFNEKWQSGFFTPKTGNPRLDMLVFVLLNGAWFLFELCTSAFCGLITFFFCMSAKMDPAMTGALVGLSGYAGGSMLNYLLRMGKAILAKKFEVTVIDTPSPTENDYGNQD